MTVHVRRAIVTVPLVATLWLSASGTASTLKSDSIWFCPGPGTPDYLRLFEKPNEWVFARVVAQVFKFYQQHTLMPPEPIVGPNTYDALVRAGAFHRLTAWHKKIALEVASVKEFYCTEDESGMNASIEATLESLRAVKIAGGTVTFLAMDEPFVSGRAKRCGGPALEPTADRVAAYMSAVQRFDPTVRIGLIEAYPFSSADAIESMLQLLRSRGTPPAFLHMDVDWHALPAGQDDFPRDMKRLQALSQSQSIPFGIIITGYNGDADSLYAVDADALSDLIRHTFERWEAMPDQLIFQSWAESQTGLRITPNNLPEDRADTHTFLLSEIFRRLWNAAGTAVPRQ
jgi:hypothetical protein